jgi:nicotinate-nucleotide adenylyltransferase
MGARKVGRAIRKVGILGGSFNPPHICHLLASRYLLETSDLEEIWWIPVYRHAFEKDRELGPFSDRVAMCEAVAEQTEGIRVDSIESELGERSWTIDTVSALRSRHPGVEFSWVIGSDLLGELHLWSRWDELVELLSFVVLGRGEEVASSSLPAGGRFEVRDFQLPDVSSTVVRDRISEGVDFRHLVPAAVFDYLCAHPTLYR